MSFRFVTAGTSLAVLLCALAGGCGSGRVLPEGETGTVTGKVTIEGVPVPEGIIVTFQRDEDGQLASGACDSDGEFVLRMKGGLAVVVGAYRVAVMPPQVGVGMSSESMMEASVDGSLTAKSKASDVIPAKYTGLQGSKTLFQVKAGSNVFELDMKK